MRTIRHGAARRCWLVLALAAFTVGCGSSGGVARTGVSGEVTLDGKPVPFGSVQFIPVGAASGPMASAQVTDGRFELSAADGPVIGQLRVEIRTDFGRMHPGEGPEQLAKRYHGLPPETIPPRYHRDSELKVTTAAGTKNHFSFPLQSDGSKATEAPINPVSKN